MINSDQLKAVVAIHFSDHIVRGFRISPSKFQHEESGEFLRVLPPAYGVGEKTHVAFFMEDKNLWKDVENKIIEAYVRTLNGGVNEEIDVDDMVF